MIGLREDRRERGELLAMIVACLPAPRRSKRTREKSASPSEYLREPARSCREGTDQAAG
ncbi:Uncharacterised protein [Pseudomonas fluorescens]|uniref:Uncharacterized protein n=1 Tax=Pseudomonas fluorescens TaxID=294 RepID=A0A379IKL2_PSEFL|nr:Uncharacterised protein [Pseudomonas fluorescens]